MIGFEFSSITAKLRNMFPFNELKSRKYWHRKALEWRNSAVESRAIHGCEFNEADFLKEYPPKECPKL